MSLRSGTRRLIFSPRIVSASVAGLGSYALSPGEANRLDRQVCQNLEALLKGRAYDNASTETDGHSLTNAQLLHKWRVLPFRAEVAIRRWERAAHDGRVARWRN